MKWIEAKVVFDFDDKRFATDIISNIFYELGLQGVVVEEPDVKPLEGWADEAKRAPDHYAVTGYFPKNEKAGKRCRILEKESARLEKENGIICRIVYREIDEEDWAESWKEFFWPVKISGMIVIKPTWREYYPEKDEIVVEIDPGMAFGTGTHPTTGMCINIIEKYLKKGDSFLDVGTGTGILMISAAKLGAAKVCGIDIDEVAVEIARKNLLQNTIDKERFKVITGNLVNIVEERFDFVAANILSQVILVLLESVIRVLAEDGIFVCSGIIEENKDTVVEKMEELGFEIIEILTEEGWVSIAGRLKDSGGCYSKGLQLS